MPPCHQKGLLTFSAQGGHSTATEFFAVVMLIAAGVYVTGSAGCPISDPPACNALQRGLRSHGGNQTHRGRFTLLWVLLAGALPVMFPASFFA